LASSLLCGKKPGSSSAAIPLDLRKDFDEADHRQQGKNQAEITQPLCDLPQSIDRLQRQDLRRLEIPTQSHNEPSSFTHPEKLARSLQEESDELGGSSASDLPNPFN
jgi:hypothetical protein